MELPGILLSEYYRERGRSRVGRLVDTANSLGAFCETIVVLGDAAVRRSAEASACESAHPFYNLLSRGERGGRPRIVFIEPTLDVDVTQATLDLVRHTSDALDPHDRWGLVIATPEDAGSASPAAESLVSALRRSSSSDEDLRRRLYLLGDDAEVEAFFDVSNVPHTVLPRIADGGAFDGAAVFASALVGADVVAKLKGAVWFWEEARRDPTLRLAPLVELLGHEDLHVVAWHHALRYVARVLERPLIDGAGRDGRSSLAELSSPRLHLFSAAVRHDRPEDANSTPPSTSSDSGQFGTFVPTPVALRDALDDVRRAESAAGITSAVIRLERLNDTALGELCGWLTAAKLVAASLLNGE